MGQRDHVDPHQLSVISFSCSGRFVDCQRLGRCSIIQSPRRQVGEMEWSCGCDGQRLKVGDWLTIRRVTRSRDVAVEAIISDNLYYVNP